MFGGGGRATRFELALHEHERDRHASILLVDGAPSGLPPPVRGFSAADVLRSSSRGFLPLEQAAAAIGATEAEVVDLVDRGLLAGQLRGRALYVQPALVTITRVTDRRHA